MIQGCTQRIGFSSSEALDMAPVVAGALDLPEFFRDALPLKQASEAVLTIDGWHRALTNILVTP